MFFKMEIFNKVSKILDLVILSVSLLGMFFVFSIFQPLNSDEIAVYAEKEELPYKEISLENSPFFLNPPKIKPNFDKIKDKIIISKIDSRPDLLNENLFDAYIQGQDKISIKYDQIVFLEMDDQENLRLSQKSNLYFSIRPHQANNVKIRFTVDLNGVNTTLDSYSDEFIVELDFEKNKTAHEEAQSEISMLFNAKAYDEDFLYSITNSKAIEKSNKRLEIDGSILFVEEGDILIFKDNHWIKKTDEKTKNFIICQIREIRQDIKMVCWSIDGEKKYYINLSFDGSKNSSLKSDFISNVKFRTKNYISCMLGKQRLILKEKDLVIKKDTRFKVVKKSIDFKDIQKEEVFYFDKIIKKNKERYLVGYIFSPMHTTFQKIEILITSSINQNRSKRGTI